jgi:CRISPR-associated protein Csx14
VQRSSANPPVAFVATLGGKPQVYTYALDALIARHRVTVSHAAALHLSTRNDARQADCLARLEREIRAHYAPAPRFHATVIRAEPRSAVLREHRAPGPAIDTVDDPRAPDAIWLTAQRLIEAYKEQGCVIHLCVTGGPRLLALQTLSAASLLLESHDVCWTVNAPPKLRERVEREGLLHMPAEHRDAVQLIRVPLMPLGGMFPHLRAAARLTPQDLIAEGSRQLDAQERARCKQVLRNLAPRAREALRAFARGAASVGEVARALGVTVATIDAYKTQIYDECRAAWALGRREPRHYSFLREHFGAIADDPEWDEA